MPIRSPRQSSAVPARNASSEGVLDGYRTGLCIGWSNSLAWYESFCLLWPMWTRQGLSPASSLLPPKTNPPGRDLFRYALWSPPRLGSAGPAALGPYVADKGYEGEETQSEVAPKPWGAHPLSTQRQQRTQEEMAQAAWRRAASIHQINRDRLRKAARHFGLRRERPQDTAGCASSSGGAGGAAQLPHLAQRTTQPFLVGSCRFAGLAISSQAKSLRHRRF